VCSSDLLARSLAENEEESAIITMLLDDYYQLTLHAPVDQPSGIPAPERAPRRPSGDSASERPPRPHSDGGRRRGRRR
jgi:ATP-dependent RNA helicase DeaD